MAAFLPAVAAARLALRAGLRGTWADAAALTAAFPSLYNGNPLQAPYAAPASEKAPIADSPATWHAVAQPWQQTAATFVMGYALPAPKVSICAQQGLGDIVPSSAAHTACAQLMLCHALHTSTKGSSKLLTARQLLRLPCTPAAQLISTSNSTNGTTRHASSSSADGASNGSSARDSAGKSNKDQLWTIPNMLSIGRGLSGPPIAYLILQHQWPVACAAVIISGITDWLDGYMARRMGLQSVLGSYLDPLGDKMLVCCVAGALAHEGLIPGWVAGVIIARDVSLVAGMTLHRWRMLGWRRVGIVEFFETGPQAAPPSAPAAAPAADGSAGGGAAAAGGAAAGGAVQGMPYMKPLLISKANTVLQLGLIAGCLSKAWVAWPAPDQLEILEVTTACTTLLSSAAYAYKYAAGKML